MSDLNECIQSWRDRFEQTGSFDPATLDEISTDGLSAEERVMMAAHRLGASAALTDQFMADDPVTSKSLPQRLELRFEPLWCTSSVGYWWWHRWGKHWCKRFRARHS